MAVTAKHVAFLGLLALVLTPVVIFAEEPKEPPTEIDKAASSDVHTLTTDSFDSFIEQNKITLVEFYAPWCGHCKNLAPHYEEAASRLKKAGGIPLAKVDATEEPELATRFEIRGYPTIKLFKNGEASDYTGGRTADTIVSWIESITGPAVEMIDEASAKAPEKGVLFVARIKEEGSKAAKAFEAVADKYRLSAKFAAIVSDKAADEMSVYRPDEEPTTIAIGEDEEAVEKWVSEERFPSFGPIDGENYAAYEGRNQEIVWFAGKEEDFTAHAKEFRECAKKFRQDYSFVWLDTERFGSHAENGLGITKLPGVVLRLKEGGRYMYPEDKKFVAKELIQFFDDVKSGKIEKFLKSEPIPETNDEFVKIVVGKNFEEMVFHKDKDVMLEIYAPWCGHCKRLEPIYNEFAEIMAPNKHIIVAKMDGTANEPPSADFSFRGFPTLFWVKAGETKPVTYNEGRTLEGLVQFVQENASKPVEVAEKEKEAEEEVKDEL